MAAPIPLAASGADRGIAAADLEPQIVTAASIEPALRMRQANKGQPRHCERGPQPERNLHARPIEFESRLACPARMLTHSPAVVQVRTGNGRCTNFVGIIKRPPEGPAGADPAARGDDRGCRIERPMRGVGRLLCSSRSLTARTDQTETGGCRYRIRRGAPCG